MAKMWSFSLQGGSYDSSDPPWLRACQKISIVTPVSVFQTLAFFPRLANIHHQGSEILQYSIIKPVIGGYLSQNGPKRVNWGKMIRHYRKLDFVSYLGHYKWYLHIWGVHTQVLMVKYHFKASYRLIRWLLAAITWCYCVLTFDCQIFSHSRRLVWSHYNVLFCFLNLQMNYTMANN